MAYIVKDAFGKEVERDGKKLFGADSVNVIKEVDMEKRILRIIATDESEDRDGDIVRVKGWKFENYLKNPVFIWAHDYSSVPLAAAVKLERKRSPWRIVLSHRFPTLGINPFADMILELYNEKIINAGSVGFIPEEWKDIRPSEAEMAEARNNTDVRRRMKYGREFLAQELLEHSGCAVPSNPAALQESVKSFSKNFKGIEGNLLDLIVGKEKFSLGEKQIDNVKAEIEEMKTKGVEVEEETNFQVQVPANYETVEGGETEEKVFKQIGTLVDELISKLDKEDSKAYKEKFSSLLKAGAVLNRKNKTRLKQAAELIGEVLTEAEPAEGEDESGKASGDQDQIADLKNSEEDSSNGNIYDELLSAEDKTVPDAEPQLAKGEPERIPVQKQKPRFDTEKVDQIISSLKRISDSLCSLSK